MFKKESFGSLFIFECYIKLQDEFNLQQYDFGARYYDPAIARWNSPDPLADLATDWTPFRYGFNNPMTFSDPSGNELDGQQSVSATTGTMAPGSLKPSGTIKYMDGVRVNGSGRSNGGPITIKTIDPNNGPTFIPSISVTSLNLPPVACPEISGGIQSIDYTAVPPSPPETVSEYEPTMWDGLNNLGNNMRQDGNYLMGFAADLSYNITNDAYISYNWVIHKESYDLRGVQTGYTKAVRCATFSWASILSLPLGWMGEGGSAAQEFTFHEGALENFAKHAFSRGRHADLALSKETISSNTVNLIKQNMSFLKPGDNTFVGSINGIQKSFKVFIKDSKITSFNMYPGISNRITDGTIINFGNLIW